MAATRWRRLVRNIPWQQGKETLDREGPKARMKAATEIHRDNLIVSLHEKVMQT